MHKCIVIFSCAIALVASPVAASSGRYVVTLQGPSVIESLASRGELAQFQSQQLSLKSSDKAQQLALDLATRQAAQLNRMQILLGGTLKVLHQFSYTNNGMALELTSAQAQTLRSMPEVVDVSEDQTFYLLTDAGPTWIGAATVWNGAGGIAGTKGEGVVVGVIDSGVNATHPSFAATGGDGYTHRNPRNRVYGLCATQPTRCNTKLIGIYDFTTEGARDGSDLDGHGSHVASTAVGNVISSAISAPTISLPISLSGVAPHANLITYKACLKSDSGGQTTCPGSSLLQAIDQAAADGVNVINYSIGGTARTNPWSTVASGGANAERAMLNARAVGVAVVVAAGNEGPIAGSIDAPANAPWVIAAANATHDRQYQTILSGISGQSAPPAGSLIGAGITAGLPTARIVLGESFGNAKCSQGTDIDNPPSGASNPFAAGTFRGEIVLCERGVQARIAKSFNVKAAGAAGMILINTELEGESTVADGHSIPTVHLGYQAGVALRNWLRTQSNATAQISAALSARNPAVGDVLNSSSSRGPEPTGTGVLKPNLSAPGTNILAASESGVAIKTLTGTSMASPHIAGALALLKSAHPTWTVDEITSTLMTTAVSGSVRKEDAVTLANPLEAGAGRTNVADAVRAGLYLPLSNPTLLSANPLSGGVVTDLNLPQIYTERCFERCTFNRVLRSTGSASNWTLSSIGSASVSITPASFALGSADSQSIRIDVDLSNPALVGRWIFGEIRMQSNDPNLPIQKLPYAVFADPGNLPAELQISADRERGFQDLLFSGWRALPRADFRTFGLVRAADESATVAVDSTATDPYDTTAGTFTKFVELPALAAGGSYVQWRVDAQGSAGDIDLFVGKDDGDGKPQSGERRCVKDGPTNIERCILDAPTAGSYWIVAQNVGGSASNIRLRFAAISSAATTSLNASAPGQTTSRQSFNTKLSYDVAGSRAGETYFGVLRPYAQTGGASLADIPITLERTSGVAANAISPLTPGQTQRFIIPAGATLDRIFVDVPPGVSQMTVTQRGELGDVNLFAAPAPVAVGTPQISAAPPRSSAAASAQTIGVNEDLVVQGSVLVPGRWYLTPVNVGGSEVSLSLQVQFVYAAGSARVPPGAYYNENRNGHGIYLTRGATGELQMIWYTYDDAGQPIFYLAYPGGGGGALTRAQSSALYRVTWGEDAPTATVVGQVILTPIANDRLTFSWYLEGRSGSEPLRLLATGSCVTLLSGNPLSLTGAWYEPSRSGYGANILARPDLESDTVYLYDSAGLPRWLIASAAPFGQTNKTLAQLQGFCPDCTAIPTTSRNVGAINTTFSQPNATGANTGNWNITADFLAPLSGAWRSTSASTVLLTGAESCVP
jgi:subtilisin family serine protease